MLETVGMRRSGDCLSVLEAAAPILLVGAIVCLMLVSDCSINVRVTIVLFTLLVALVVGLLTNTRRAEIFGATAA